MRKKTQKILRHINLILVSCLAIAVMSIDSSAQNRSVVGADVVQGVGSSNGTINWTRNYIEAKGSGMCMRGQTGALCYQYAMRAATVDAQRNLLETVKGVSVTSETKVSMMMLASDVIRTEVSGIVRGARHIGEPVQNKDGSVTVTMRMPVFGALSKVLITTGDNFLRQNKQIPAPPPPAQYKVQPRPLPPPPPMPTEPIVVPPEPTPTRAPSPQPPAPPTPKPVTPPPTSPSQGRAPDPPSPPSAKPVPPAPTPVSPAPAAQNTTSNTPTKPPPPAPKPTPPPAQPDPLPVIKLKPPAPPPPPPPASTVTSSNTPSRSASSASGTSERFDKSRTNYDGLVIDAREQGAKPSMLPVVYSGSGDVVYSRDSVQDAETVKNGIVGYAKAVEGARRHYRVASDPLVIKAIDAHGTNNSDVVISDKAANYIQTTEPYSSYLRNGRVMIVFE